MGIYSEIKSRVKTRDVAKHYGYKVNRAGMMCCPFHDDRRPSMKVDQNYICFGCQEKGDVIRFVSELYGLSPYDAAVKIIEDMRLDIPTTYDPKRPRPSPDPERIRKENKRREAQMFEQTVRKIYDVYCDYLHLLEHWSKVYAPRSPDDALHPLFEEAIQKKDQVDHILDLLLYGTAEEKAQVVIHHGKEVAAYEERILGFKTGNREYPAHSIIETLSGNDDRGDQGTSGSEQERNHKEFSGEFRDDLVS